MDISTLMPFNAINAQPVHVTALNKSQCRLNVCVANHMLNEALKIENLNLAQLAKQR